MSTAVQWLGQDVLMLSSNYNSLEGLNGVDGLKLSEHIKASANGDLGLIYKHFHTFL